MEKSVDENTKIEIVISLGFRFDSFEGFQVSELQTIKVKKTSTVDYI